MEVIKKACAGTREKSDIEICITPGNAGIRLSIESVVKQQFGKAIGCTIYAVLEEMNVKDAVIEAQDFGAPDFVIRARMKTALLRAAKEETL